MDTRENFRFSSEVRGRIAARLSYLMVTMTYMHNWPAYPRVEENNRAHLDASSASTVG
jgi:hypothetical protein